MRLAQSELRSPASSASPILPAPRIAIRIAQAYESGAIARQEVDARQPGPFLVRSEQRIGLLGLDPAPPERGGELDEPEVAREPALVAAEAVQADDADGPRPEAALAEQPGGDRLGRVRLQRLEVEAAAEADECRAAARAEAEPLELGGREAREVGRGRRRVQGAE